MNAIRSAVLFGLLGLLAPSATATQAEYHPPTDVVNPEKSAVEAAYAALMEEYMAATYAWYDELDAVQARNEKGAQEKYPESPDGAFYARFWALAQQGQVDARLWCLGNFGFSETPKDRRMVTKLRLYLELIDNAHKTHGEALIRTIASEAEDWGDSLGRELAFALLDELAAVSGDPNLAARAIYTKASALEWSREENAEDLALQQYELLMERFPEHELTKRAAGKIFASENLQIGMEVPDIVGVDVDGKPLKLSDYQGKVAVIDFWGFW